MISFKLNGQDQQVDIDPAMPLLWVLRDELKLTGTKFGCGVAACGACTVLLDGQAVRTCVLPVSAVQDRSVSTIELGGDTELPPDTAEPKAVSPAPDLDKASAEQRLILQTLQQAWIAEQVPQCGYCQSGMLMAATSLLSQQAIPDQDQIDRAMTNLCRCGTYQRISRAIDRAARMLAEKSA